MDIIKSFEKSLKTVKGLKPYYEYYVKHGEFLAEDLDGFHRGSQRTRHQNRIKDYLKAKNGHDEKKSSKQQEQPTTKTEPERSQDVINFFNQHVQEKPKKKKEKKVKTDSETIPKDTEFKPEDDEMISKIFANEEEQSQTKTQEQTPEYGTPIKAEPNPEPVSDELTNIIPTVENKDDAPKIEEPEEPKSLVELFLSNPNRDDLDNFLDIDHWTESLTASYVGFSGVTEFAINKFTDSYYCDGFEDRIKKREGQIKSLIHRKLTRTKKYFERNPSAVKILDACTDELFHLFFIGMSDFYQSFRNYEEQLKYLEDQK